MKKRIAALLLTLAVMVTFMPAMALTAFADPTEVITFTDGYSNPEQTYTQEIGSSATLDAVKFTREGYTFKGWADVTSGDNDVVAYEDQATVTKHKPYRTLKALWTKYCVITLMDGEDEVAVLDPAEVGTDLADLTIDAPTKTGYDLLGWFDDETKYFNADGTAAVDYVPDEEALTLNTVWEAHEYTVEFAAGADKATGTMEPMNLTYDQEETALTANSFERTGYEFVNWTDGDANEYDDEELVQNLTDEDDATITMTAQWLANEYTVVFDAGEGKGSMEPMTLTYDDADDAQGTALATNEFTKTGYHFTGWNGSDGNTYTDGEEVLNMTAVKDDVITLTAQWAPNKYTVVLHGKNKNVNQTFIYDQAQKLNDAPKATGYYFKGWATKAGGSVVYTENQKVKNLSTGEKVDLYAVYKPYKLVAKSFASGKNGVKTTWNAVPGAKYYVAAGNYCGSKANVKSPKIKGTYYVRKNLKKGQTYRFTVKAYNSKGKVIATAPTTHSVVGGYNATYANVKTVKAVASVSLAKGATKKLAPQLTLVKTGKKILGTNHAAKFRYATTDKAVATVSNGKIKAIGKGTCYVYTIATNGARATTKVVVK